MAAGAKGVGNCHHRRVGMSALLVCGQNIGLNPGAMPSDAGRQGTMAFAADSEIRHWIRMIGDNRQVKRSGAMAIFAANRSLSRRKHQAITKRIVAAQTGRISGDRNCGTLAGMSGSQITLREGVCALWINPRVCGQYLHIIMAGQTAVHPNKKSARGIGAENRGGDVFRRRVGGATATAGSQSNEQ